ncbi:MAG TPA: YHS domain-containing (seleno)protein [Spirosoma sp.]|jgi:YHS domain-containing protein|nr:YHS domain-containing (seleno)protein [Spirosoma sp.]
MKQHILRLTILLLLSITTAFAQQPAGRRSEVFAPNGKAINGYDPVTYFTESKPVEGDPKIAYNYLGADWYFASEKNRDAFKADPEKYAPQYGGYCAFGTSRGYKAPTQADAWTITDDKLYLNYNTKVRTEWNKDQAGYIKKADANWPTIKDKDPK